MKKRVQAYKVSPRQPKEILSNASLDICLELVRLYYHDAITTYGARNVIRKTNNSFDVYQGSNNRQLSYSIYWE